MPKKEEKDRKTIEDSGILRGSREIAAYLKCSISTFMERVRQGLPATKLNGEAVYYATKDDLDEWMKEQIRRLKEEDAPRWERPKKGKKKKKDELRF